MLDEPVTKIVGVIDALGSGRIGGWVSRRCEGTYVGGLRIELRRGGAVLSEVRPAGPRLDVLADASLDLAFSLECDSIDELLDGILTVVAVDPSGQEHPLEVYPPVRASARRGGTPDKPRPAGARSVAEVMQALSQVRPSAPPHPDRQPPARTEPARGEARFTRAAVGPRIVFLGAGSTVFAKNLLGDILGEPALSASRICLYDIDPERLRVSEVVAGRIVQALDAPAQVTATTDLGQALDGADYAINMIQVGGYRPCTVTDFEIPNRHGLRQTIGDTLGIGGIMRALRTIPVLLDMVREMERRCPDVLHLNYVNPMAMNCWALSRASRIRTVGLCHSVQGTAAELAADIGVPVERIDYLAAGINHMAFYLRFSANGEDLYPRIREVGAARRMPPHNRVRYDLLDRFGYFVTESSEHFAEYVPWYIKRDRPDLIERLNIPLDEYPRRCELQIAAWTEQGRVLQDLSRPIAVERSHEYGGRIINAIETGVPAVVYGNVSNAGLIDNLPPEACVEVPCLVDGTGLHPVQVGRLPLQLAALMQTNVSVQALAVEAALTGRRDHVYHAAMLDPHTAAELDPDQITRLVDDLLDAHRPWLPDALFR